MSIIDFHDEEYDMTSRRDLVRFINSLHDELKDHPEQWDNKDLGDYLDAFAAFLGSAHHYYRNMGEDVDADVPSWRLLADCFVAAISYD
jgi:hypothetical protein